MIGGWCEKACDAEIPRAQKQWVIILLGVAVAGLPEGRTESGGHSSARDQRGSVVGDSYPVGGMAGPIYCPQCQV